MARLPTPGGDNGNWGNILNDYLSQAHKADGTLKDDSVTNAAIADGSITETLLNSSVQTKLNTSGDWNTLSNKPAIVAAGGDQAAARTAIGAGTSNLVLGTSNTTAKAGDYAPSTANITDSTVIGRSLITASSAAAARMTVGAIDSGFVAAWAGADAYIDFTTKPNGDPPAVLDTGQVVDYTWGPSNWKSQLSGGKLIHGTLPASGSYADYYQAQLDGDCRSFGTRWTVDSSDGSSTNGIMCIAVWADIYQTSGTEIPKTPAHITVDTTTGTWSWFVGDGGGTSGATHLKAVKTGTFTAPASDGVAVWEVAAYVDPDNGIGYLYLPGNDTTTGTRWITVTDAEIASLLTAQGVPVTTFAATCVGADVLMVEHFASSTPNTARYPLFLDMWGNVRRRPRDRQVDLDLKLRSVPPATYKRYLPNPAVTISPTSTMAPVDATNAIVTAAAGPTGKILFEIDCYYEFTGTDVIFMRLSNGSTTTVSEVVTKGVNGSTISVHHTFEKTGLTPGSTSNWRIDHQCQNAAVTMKIGGSGGFSTLPPLYIKATPL